MRFEAINELTKLLQGIETGLKLRSRGGYIFDAVNVFPKLWAGSAYNTNALRYFSTASAPRRRPGNKPFSKQQWHAT
jgi:hypothetical protein